MSSDQFGGAGGIVRSPIPSEGGALPALIVQPTSNSNNIDAGMPEMLRELMIGSGLDPNEVANRIMLQRKSKRFRYDTAIAPMSEAEVFSEWSLRVIQYIKTRFQERDDTNVLNDFLRRLIDLFVTSHEREPFPMFLARFIDQVVEQKLCPPDTIIELFIQRLLRGDVKHPKVAALLFDLWKKFLRTAKVETSENTLRVLLSAADATMQKPMLTSTDAETADAARIVLNSLVLSDKGSIPFYTTMFEVRKHYSSADTKEPWLLGEFLDYVKMRRARLATMLTISGSQARGDSLFSVSFADQIDLYTVVPYAMQIVDTSAPKEYSAEWYRRVHHLLNALSHHASPESFFTMFSTMKPGSQDGDHHQGHAAKQESHSAQQAQQQHRGHSSSDAQQMSKRQYTARMLQEAIVLRLLQLIKESASELNDPFDENSPDSITSGVFGKWILLADQLYFLFAKQSDLDFRSILYEGPTNDSSLSIKKCIELFGDDVKDHFLIWLLLQALPSNYTKKAFLDAKDGNKDPFVSFVFSLREKQHTKEWMADMADSNMYFIALRLNTIIPLAHVPESLSDVKSRISMHIDSWWAKETDSGKLLDFYNLSKSSMRYLCLLSTYLTKPIAEAMDDFLMKPETDVAPPAPTAPAGRTSPNPTTPSIVKIPPNVNTVPNLLVSGAPLTYKGKRKPIPVTVLLVLSAHARKRLFDLCEAVLIAAGTQQVLAYPPQPTSSHHVVVPLPPSFLETYARLLYCSPGFYNSKQPNTLPNLITCAHPCVQLSITELVSFRLMRFFKYYGASIIDPLFMYTIHNIKVKRYKNLPRVFLNLETLLVKSFLYLADIEILYKVFAKNRQYLPLLGETARRTILISIARIVKVRNYTTTKQLRFVGDIMKVLQEASLAQHTVSSNTLDHFPPQLKNWNNAIMAKRTMSQPQQPPPLVINKAMLEQHVASPQVSDVVLGLSKNMKPDELRAAADKLKEIYNQNNGYLKPLFLCALWALRTSGWLNDSREYILRVFDGFSPQELFTSVYKFVDYLVDHETVPVSSVAELLSTFVWVHEYFPFEILLAALADRDNNHNAIALIDHLLLKQMEFSDRMRYFMELNIDPHHWEESDYYSKHVLYHNKYPERWGLYATPQNPPTTNPLPAVPAGKIDISNAQPSYYGNVCLRTLPILDMLCGRLIESGNTDLLYRILELYAPLFSYHEHLLTFIRDTLIYYFNSPNMKDSVRQQLYKLAASQKNASNYFSSALYTYIQELEVGANPIQPDFSETYFIGKLERVAKLMPSVPVGQQPGMSSPLYGHQEGDASPTHIFNEFASEFETQLNATIIEFMCLPSFALADITTNVFNCVLHQLDPDAAKKGAQRVHLSAELLHAAGLIIALLPSACGERLFSLCSEFIKSHPYLLEYTCNYDTQEKVGPVPCSGYVFSDFAQNSENRTNTKANTVLSLLHSFLSHSSLEILISVPILIFKTSRPVRTLEQIYFLCKIIGPFVYRLATVNNQLVLGECFLEILRCFTEINKSEYEHAIASGCMSSGDYEPATAAVVIPPPPSTSILASAGTSTILPSSSSSSVPPLATSASTMSIASVFPAADQVRLSLLSDILDFLFLCRFSLKLPQDTLKEVRPLVERLDPLLREKLKHLQ